jgi:hypothetical protein
MTYGVIMVGFFSCIWCRIFYLIPVPAMLTVGFSQGKATTRLILQKLSAKDGPVQDITGSMMSPLVLFALGSYLKNREGLLLASAWTLVAIVVIDVLVFHAHATSDLKQARDINVFSMKKAPGTVQDTGFYVCGSNLQVMRKAWQEFAADEKRVKATYFNVGLCSDMF